MRIENWCIIPAGFNPYLAPEVHESRISGQVYESPKFNDGDIITTSAIINTKEGNVYTKSGSIYKLGCVDPDYEEAFPNAYYRLFNKSYD